MGLFYQITDDAFPGAKSIDFIGQRIVYVEPFGRYWGWSDLVDASSWNSLETAQAETSPDRIQGLIVSHNEVLVFGERTIEPWSSAPTDTAVFQLQVGSVIESGCASGKTIKRLDNSVFYLTNSGQVARLNGYTPQIVSTQAIETAIRGLNWSRAFAFTWEDSGHAVYYITFPDGNTWGYDARQGKWHRRESFALDRWRVNALVKSNRTWFAGDFQNGRVYELEWGNVYEGCEIMPRKLRTGVLHNAQNRIPVHGFQLVASSLPPIFPQSIDAAGVETWRWLATGQTAAGSRASIRALTIDMEWYGSVDVDSSSVNTNSARCIKQLGDYVVSVLNSSAVRIAPVASIESWSAGPTLPAAVGNAGNAAVIGGRLYVALGYNGIAYIDAATDTAFTADTGMTGLFVGGAGGAMGITGNGSNLLLCDVAGRLMRSSGGAWSAGVSMGIDTPYGAMDSNGDRVVIAGRNGNPLAARYTDDNGATVNTVTITALANTSPAQTKYIGNDTWLIACNNAFGAPPASGHLYKSTDNGETFTAITLPVGLNFANQYQQNIAVDSVSGRVVIVGQDAALAWRYFYSDNLVTWTEIPRTGTAVTGITEVYPPSAELPPQAEECTPMESGTFQLRYSDDGANNYSNWRDFAYPTTGQFMQPLIARRLGMTRHRVWEIMDTSNRPQEILAASIILE